MLAGPPFTRSSAAFFTLWRHYYSFYFPVEEQLASASEPRHDEKLYVLTGNDTECQFQVEAAGNHTDTSSFSFPLPIPRPENRAGFSFPFDTSHVTSERGIPLSRDEEIIWDKEEEEYQPHQEFKQMRPNVSLVSSRERPQSIASLRVSDLCKRRSFSSFSTTIVMGLWRLPAPALHSSKTVRRYMQQFRLGLELFAKHALVMFANSDYLPLVHEAVQEAAARETEEASGLLLHTDSLLNRVCIVPLELEELPYAFIGSHVRLAASAAIRDPRVLIDWWNHPYFNEGYHVLQLSKFDLTAEVALINPFNSRFILWTDPPKRKYFPDGSDAIDRFLDGRFLEVSVKKGAVLMQETPQRIHTGPWNAQCHKGIFDMHAKYAPGLAGGLFGGTPFAFSRVLPVWDAAARALLSLSILNDEQHLHTLVACSFPSLFHIIPYHLNCSPHFLCGSRTIAEVHPNAEVSFDFQGRRLKGPLPKSIWKDYPFPVSTSMNIPEALYVNSDKKEDSLKASGR
ncbi:hypothetical protein Emag_002539 [Eimeria magna]